MFIHCSGQQQSDDGAKLWPLSHLPKLDLHPQNIIKLAKTEEKKITGKSILFYKTNCFLRNSVSHKVKSIFMASSPKLGENLSVLENDWSIKKTFILIKVARSSN